MKINDLTKIALSVVLIAIGSWMSISIGNVPITLQIFSITLFAFLLKPKHILVSVISWIIMGVIGIPVFANFQRGPAVVIGPTGGFILGFIIFAFLVSFFYQKKPIFGLIAAFVFLFLVVYLSGLLWIMNVLNLSLQKALIISVYPFVIFDIIKIVFAYIIAKVISIRLKYN